MHHFEPDNITDVAELTNGRLTVLMKDEAGAPVPLSDLDSLTLDLYHLSSKNVINDRDHQDALNVNNVTVAATSGEVIWAWLPEDMPFLGVDTGGRQITEIVAHFRATWDGGDKQAGYQHLFRVHNFKRYPPDGSPTP